MRVEKLVCTRMCVGRGSKSGRERERKRERKRGRVREWERKERALSIYNLNDITLVY